VRFDDHNPAAVRLTRVRALFLSDVHLGSRSCRGDRFADFLRHYRADAIYLVGDIVDGWRLRAHWYWPATHSDILLQLLNAARLGAKVVYIPGNHDAFLRDYCGIHFAGIEVADSAIHRGADGRRYLVVHGDHFDRMMDHAQGFAALGHRANRAALAINAAVNHVRRSMGLSYWPLTQWAKRKFKNAINYIGDFEQALANVAKSHGVDGVICGHIHHAVIHENFGIRYINCGDWIESCTAVVEHEDGVFEILQWMDRAPQNQRAFSLQETSMQEAGAG
jgi:UDP-2,3-diacylglucosamine pyrophosphatase LpxH